LFRTVSIFLYINGSVGIEQGTVWFDNFVQCLMPLCELRRPDASLLASIWI